MIPSVEPTTKTAAEPPKVSRVKIWDLPVRLFHWSLVLSFVGAYASNWLGVNYFDYHAWFGYAVITLVVFRLLWGIWGTYHARFRNFIRDPKTTAGYAVDFLRGREKPYLGHNPLGAVMVLVLLLALLVQAVTGLFSNDEIFNTGPLYGYVSNEVSLALTGLHQQLFYWILGAVVVHVLAVVLHLVWKKDNLVRAMFSGYKSAGGLQEHKPVESSRLPLALGLMLVVAGLLVLVIGTAPEAVLETEY